MRAIAYRQPGPIDRADALIDVELPRPIRPGVTPGRGSGYLGEPGRREGSRRRCAARRA